MKLDFNSVQSNMVEYSFVFCLIWAAVSLYIRWSEIPLLTIFVATICYTFSIYSVGTDFSSPYIFFSSAARYLLPLVVFYGLRFLGTDDINWMRSDLFWYLLRFSLAATFLGHGMEAIAQNPIFIDYIIYFSVQVLDYPMLESHAALFLNVIGFVDLWLALIICIDKSFFAISYMAFWGMATSLMRIIFSGLAVGADEFLFRTAHWGIPLALLYVWKITKKNKRSRSCEISYARD